MKASEVYKTILEILFLQCFSFRQYKKSYKNCGYLLHFCESHPNR